MVRQNASWNRALGDLIIEIQKGEFELSDIEQRIENLKQLGSSDDRLYDTLVDIAIHIPGTWLTGKVAQADWRNSFEYQVLECLRLIVTSALPCLPLEEYLEVLLASEDITSNLALLRKLL